MFTQPMNKHDAHSRQYQLETSLGIFDDPVLKKLTPEFARQVPVAFGI